MTQTQRTELLFKFAKKHLVWRRGSFLFTEHLIMLYAKEINNNRIIKDRFMQDLCSLLRSNLSDFGAPSDAIVRSDFCHGVSAKDFMLDNNFSIKCLMDFDWVNPNADLLCQRGPDFLERYLETRNQKKSKYKRSSLYFQPERHVKLFMNDKQIDSLIKEVFLTLPDDANYNANKNVIFLLMGIVMQNRDLKEEIKKLKDMLRRK